MAHQFSTSYIQDSLSLFRFYKKLVEGAMEQVTDDQLFATLDEEMNSIAIIVKHIAGNMRSRWTDFLTSDGEKPDRNRDSEFVEAPASREAMLEMWNAGWAIDFGALEPDRCGFGPHRDDPQGAPFGDAGDSTAGRALRDAHRANRVHRKALE